MRPLCWIASATIALFLLGACATTSKSPTGQVAGSPSPRADVARGDGKTLGLVKSRGRLVCGVSTGLYGFSAQDSSKGYWGFDVDYCRAIAAAIFGDATKVEYRPVSTQQRFVALQSGDIDLLARNSVWTLARDGQLGLDFAAVTFFEGQGFMVREDRHVQNMRQMPGAKICVQAGTTTEWNLRDYATKNRIALLPVTFAENAQAREAYDAGQCDAYTADATALAGERTALADPAAHAILPERISKEPLAPIVRQGDNQWTDIVRWAHFAMLTAEELGITQATVEEVRQSSQDFTVQMLLGSRGDIGRGLGLDNDWAYDIIKQVGNYGEVFKRNLTDTVGIERALNGLWNKGGLQFSPPIR